MKGFGVREGVVYGLLAFTLNDDSMASFVCGMGTSTSYSLAISIKR
ncbi:MAG: hypothetical protein RMK18_06675 [Armatimonadota bacterium]|nr:hypothetical protein [Armatimonadota bacterium]MDW8025532.1 hypothetical protein [Armatimonadota bacterium]